MRMIDADALLQSLGVTDIDCEKCAWYDKELSHCKRGGDFEDACFAIEDAPTAQPKKGKWEKIKVFPAGEIELQSARCSACKRYHTTPYLYNYTHYNFCPHCSARMVNEDV